MTAPYRILFVGNSYTSRNDLPALVKAMAAEAGFARTVETELVAFGGASLAAHWNRGGVQRLLKQQRWDAVVLQDQSTRALRAPASLQEYGRKLADAALAVGAAVFLYVVWARRDDPDSQQVISAAHEALARDSGAALVRVGPAWQRVRECDPALALYDADGSHPTSCGSYLAACVFCAALFDIAVGGTAGVPPEMDAGRLGLIRRTGYAFGQPTAA